MDDPLLGRHDRRTPELAKRNRDLHEIPLLKVRVIPARLLQADLASRIFDVGYDFLQHHDADVAVVVDLDLGLDRAPEPARQRGVDPLTDEIVQLVV